MAKRKNSPKKKSTEDWVNLIRREVKAGKKLEEVIAANLKMPVDAIRRYSKEAVGGQATKKRDSSKHTAASHGCDSRQSTGFGRLRNPRN